MSLFRSVTEMVEPFQIRTSGAATGNVLVVNSDGLAVWSEAIPIATDAVAITQGTIAAQAAGLSQTVTWNNVAETFIAQTLSVTDTASAAASLLAQWQVGGSSVFEVTKTGAVSIGAAAQAGRKLRVGGTQAAASGSAYGLRSTVTLVAAANNDNLIQTSIATAFTPGAFTGLLARGLQIDAFSVAGFTSPGNPIAFSVGVLTGTGASIATAVSIAPPTGATTNYLIAHTTPATFNVTAAGIITTAVNIVAGTTIAAGTTLTAGTGLTVTTGGATITGNSTITGTLGGLTGLTVASGVITMGATAGVTAGPFTAVSSIQTIGGIVTTLTGT